MESKAVMVVGGEPRCNAWVRDGLAAAPQSFVLSLDPVDLPPAKTGTPPQAVRRLLNPSFAKAVRRTVSQDGMWSAFRHALRQTMQARLGHRHVVGIPDGLGFAEWLADECQCRIVCLASHPLSVAAHHKRQAKRSGDPDWIERACREWVVASEWIAGFRERRRDFAFVWDEEIVGEPFVGFHRLYRQLDLPWSPRCQSAISSMMKDRPDRSVDDVQPDAWRSELTSDEVIRVRTRAEARRASHPQRLRTAEPATRWPKVS